MLNKIKRYAERARAAYTLDGMRGLVFCLREWRWMNKMRHAGLDLEFVDSDADALKIGRLGHQATPAPDLSKILKTFAISNTDSIIDVGSGKGGALLSMAGFPFGRIAGLEFCPEFYRIAKENILKSGIINVSLISADATRFEHYADYNYIYLFNPFFGQVFDDFMHKLIHSLVSHPRKLTILYAHPTCHSMVMQHNIFKKVNEFRLGYYPLFVYVHNPD